jgi:hypothetical protein
MNKIVWLFGLALVLAGCGDAPAEATTTDPLDQTGTWRLATMTADGVTTDRPEAAMGK